MKIKKKKGQRNKAKESILMIKLTENQILEGLKKHFPEPKIELNYQNPFQLLIAVILSAQTTDKRVNEVSPKLFQNIQHQKN